MLGWKHEEVIGLKALDFLFSEKYISQAEPIIDTLRNGQSWSGEIILKRRDGALLPFLTQSSPVIDKKGIVIGAVAIGKDITELKNVERMKDEFISLVSHELRTPLTIITGSLQSMTHPEISPEDAHELLKNVVDSAASMVVILDNMLELARYQASGYI